MGITDQFRADVEAYLERSAMDPTTFGKHALKDPSFVFALRGGRSPRGDTMDRVHAWMRDNPPNGTVS